MTCASLGFLKQRLLGSTSVLQALPAKPKRQHPRDSARSRRRPGAGGGLSTDLFRVEPLEPRLLLSADLAPHAQDAILTGLAHFTQDVQKLNTNTTADAHLPFINLPVANIANFGSLATTLQTAVGNYFAHSNTPTVNTQGLADALEALPATGGNVALQQQRDGRDPDPVAQFQHRSGALRARSLRRACGPRREDGRERQYRGFGLAVVRPCRSASTRQMTASPWRRRLSRQTSPRAASIRISI